MKSDAFLMNGDMSFEQRSWSAMLGTMPRARRELLDAALTYFDGSENRLTEVFATVLEAHGGFARALFDRVGIELPDGVRFEAYTQKTVAEGCRPDMALLAFQDRHLVAQLWSEHKIDGGGFRDMQLEDYRDALAREPSQHRLVGIVADLESGSGGPDWRILRWQEVAELANSVGIESAADGVASDWRKSALGPAALARQRLLHEFIWYVEEENGAVVNPLSSDNLQAFQKAAETTVGLLTLLERAAGHMRDEFEPDEDPDGAEDGGYYWQLFATPQRSWLHRIQAGGFDAYPELMAAAEDSWWSGSRGEPAFGVGYTLDAQMYESLAADADWLARLAHAGIDFDLYDGWLRVFCTKPIADVLGEGSTLDEQARALARWAKRGLTTVGELDPGDFEMPLKRTRQRSRNTSDSDGSHDGQVTQQVTAKDIDAGVIRIPLTGHAKSLFPGRAADVEIDLRGTKLTVKWNPSLARAGSRERSGRLYVGREALTSAVKANERLRVDQINGSIRLI